MFFERPKNDDCECLLDEFCLPNYVQDNSMLTILNINKKNVIFLYVLFYYSLILNFKKV